MNFFKIISVAFISVLIVSCSTQRISSFKKSRFEKRAIRQVEKAAIIENLAIEEETAQETEVVTATIEEKQVFELTKLNAKVKTVADSKIKQLNTEIISYNSKTRKEKKEIRKEFKQLLKSGRFDLPYEPSEEDTVLILLVILAILLPPLAVYLLKGISNEFWLDLILSIFFWLPGIIYALYLILV